MAVDSDPHLAILKASYDYKPQSDDEIAIKEDQILFLKERVDEDWWKVKLKDSGQGDDGPVGLVPAAYVEPADHSSVVKALYDYEASAPGELTIAEDEILLAFDTEEDWLLVQSTKEGGKAGYVPANYVEAHTEEEDEAAAAPPQIIVPPDPPRPTSTYVDPAVRVASSKLSADDIQTWSVSEVDKKGKKMKGTLGIGNGAVFFASETSKAAVQKWQTSDISNIIVEKSKHVHFDVGGASPTSLHFSVGSKENAEAIVAKLESSRAISSDSQDVSSEPTADGDEEPEPEPEPEPETETETATPSRPIPPPLDPPKKASVHFSPASPQIIPPRSPSIDEEDTDDATHHGVGEPAVALYDFKADGDDELTITEGERLLVIEKDGDEWWKCRNAKGHEGVVPASYIELAGGDSTKEAAEEEDERAAAMAREEEEERARKEAEAAEAERIQKEKAEKEEKERREKERQRQETAKRAEAAEKERQRRKDAAAAAAAKSASPPPSSPELPARTKPTGSSSGRGSTDNGRPPPEKVRVWHDRTGQFRVDAAFLGFNNGKLRLHKTNGVIVEVPEEKMSVEDLRYVEKLTSRRKPSKKISEDDIPLAIQQSGARNKAKSAPRKERIDWFEFFLNAGCDMDDCTRYASAFERDKIDGAILGDLTESTLRSLSLREGDIIRVMKAIQTTKPPVEKPRDHSAQIAADEEMARQLQAEENAGKSKTPPSLFAGPGGALKNRRGRPKPSGSLPPAAVDMNAIGNASDSLQRTSSPQLVSPINRPSSTPVQAPPRPSSTVATTSGFDDDAWTPREKSPAPATALRAPSAPPAATAPPPAASAPPASVPPKASSPPPAPPAPAAQPTSTSAPVSLAKTTESDIFDQLARLSELRKSTPAVATPTVAMQNPPTNISSPPPAPFQGAITSSPSPLGQPALTGVPHLQAQQPYNGPRGPFAPVPVNQALLQPLVPTQTGFNNFIPTRPPTNPSPFANPPQQPSFLQAQPTGFPGMPPQQAMVSQPTGMPFGGTNSINGGMNGSSPIQPTSPFGPVATNPTGFNPGFGGSPFTNGISSPPPVPPLPSSTLNNTNPANIFAQMKSGTFANDNESSGPQPSDKYDSLRPNPLAAQATGWGSYQSGFVGYR